MNDNEQDSPINPEHLKSQVVDELKDFFTSQFNEFRRDVRADSEWAVESARKKVRSDNFISFKSLANRKQYEFNSEIFDLISATSKAFDLRDARKGKEYLKEAQDKIKHRNKIIRIADSSSAGWATIQEYELYDVASDSDDDKRIRRAEERARAKIDKARKAAETPSNPYSSSNTSDYNSFRSSRGNFTRPPTARQFQRSKPGDIVCYACGQLGHFSSGCAVHLRQTGLGAQPGFAGSVVQDSGKQSLPVEGLVKQDPASTKQ